MDINGNILETSCSFKSLLIFSSVQELFEFVRPITEFRRRLVQTVASGKFRRWKSMLVFEGREYPRAFFFLPHTPNTVRVRMYRMFTEIDLIKHIFKSETKHESNFNCNCTDARNNGSCRD